VSNLYRLGSVERSPFLKVYLKSGIRIGPASGRSTSRAWGFHGTKRNWLQTNNLPEKEGWLGYEPALVRLQGARASLPDGVTYAAWTSVRRRRNHAPKPITGMPVRTKSSPAGTGPGVIVLRSSVLIVAGCDPLVPCKVYWSVCE
jgi:hypothetical protein